MKTCPNCGNQVADEALFCNNCGTNMTGVEKNTVSGAVDAAGGIFSSTSDSAANAAESVNQTENSSSGFQSQFNQPQGFQTMQGFQGQQTYASSYDPADHTAEFDPRDIADNRLFAILTYFASIPGIIVALLVRESAYTRFHAKNEIRLMLASILAMIPAIIPVLGWFITGILELVIFVVRVIAIVYAFQDKARDLPFIGGIGLFK